MLFLGIYDSKRHDGVWGSPHSSFELQGTEGEEKRESCETRFFGKSVNLPHLCGSFE